MRKEAWFGLSIMAAVVIAPLRPDAAGIADNQRPPGAPDAGADRRGDHARLSHGVHTDGPGDDVHLVCLPQRGPVAGGAADARFDGPAGLLGHDQRRFDLGSPVRLHGLSGRARQSYPGSVQGPAPGDLAHSRVAGGCNDRHLCDLRHRFRDHRRGGDADGPARLSGDAESRIQRPGRGGLRDRGRHPRHPDPAVGPVDPLRRHRRRLGDAALRRRLLSRPHAGGIVRPLCHHLRKNQAQHRAAALGGGPVRAAAQIRGGHYQDREQQRHDGPDRRDQGQAQRRRPDAHPGQPPGHCTAAGPGGRAAHGLDLSCRDRSGLRGALGVAGNGLCGGGRGRQCRNRGLAGG